MGNDKIRVEVAYATPEQQRIVALEVEPGAVAYDVAVQSGIDCLFPEIDFASVRMGIFGKVIQARAYTVRAGDRIEIYRPLIVDPKVSRQLRAEKARAARK